MRNLDIYLDFTADPDLASALSETPVGTKIKLEVEVLVTDLDAKGLTGTIEPGSIVPEGYKRVEGEDDQPSATPAPPPPGSLAVTPVVQVMNGLRKKGDK